MRLLFWGTLFHFGLGAGVGAESLSNFFELIRINTHVGVSASVLRERLRQIETLLPKFQQMCEENNADQPRQATVALDETFFGNFVILVVMDLNSGYLLLEDIADDRCFDTWFEKTTPRLEQLGIKVTHAISDRARALIKMALTGFDCPSGADIFHAQNDVSRLLGGALGRRLSSAEKVLEQAQNAETKAAKKIENAQQTSESQQTLYDAQKSFESIKQANQDYHENLQGVSEDIHPFSLEDNSMNTAETIESSLESRAQVFEKIANKQGINDHKGKMKKFRKQFTALAVSVTSWRAWVTVMLQQLVVNEGQKKWFTTILLPVIYWHQQMQKTKNPKLRKKYCQAWKEATDCLKNHSITNQLPISELQHWQALAENMARQFHRSSSAVEGRNGVLSQMYHNGRGFTPQRLKALTVIHNYFIKRADGTTAAMRLFGVEHQDLFEWLLGQIGDLPLPRKGRGHIAPNPLRLLDVPS